MARIIPNNIADMQDIIEVKNPLLWDLRWFYLLIAMLGGVVLFFLGKWLIGVIKNRKKTDVLVIKNPAELALAMLDQLVEKHWIEKGMVRPFYFELSEIFKQYLENQFKVLALESTDLELKRMIRDLQLSEFIKHKTELIIKVGEMAKYAKYYPSKDEIVGTVQALRKFIQESFAEVEQQKKIEEQNVNPAKQV